MEEREPSPLTPAVIPHEDRQKQKRPEKLTAERKEQDEPQLQHNAAELRRRHGLLHRTALHEADLAPRSHRHGHRHRHDAEAADLDEEEQDELAKRRPVERRILYCEPRHAARRHSREERRQERRTLTAPRGAGQREQQRADRDEREKAQADDLERRELTSGKGNVQGNLSLRTAGDGKAQCHACLGCQYKKRQRPPTLPLPMLPGADEGGRTHTPCGTGS